ncbi:hypothetical protein BJ742DRAFT_569869 [Cladochytrium replicatum]|nr:hypothetical protein BJ742DRAFT_569869 [Cladochytrium replicatum]
MASSPSASDSRSPSVFPPVVQIALDIPPLPPSSIPIAQPQSTILNPHRAGLDPGGVLSDFEEVVLVSNPLSSSNPTSPADHRILRTPPPTITTTTTDTTTDSTSLSSQDRASSSGSVSSLASSESSSIDPHIAPQYPIVSHPWSVANRPTHASGNSTVVQLPTLQHPQPRRNGFPSTNSPVVSPQLRPSGLNWFSSLLGDEARSGSGLSTPNSVQRPTSASSFAALGRRQVLGV